MTVFDDLTYLHGKPLGHGVLKANPEDFVVVEDLGFEPDGEGEHVLVRILKNGCNTRFVADALAKFLKIHAREVSFAGQKDKHAVTEQWLCARVPGNAASVGATVMLALLALLSVMLVSVNGVPICTVVVNGRTTAVAIVKLIINVCCAYGWMRPKLQLTINPWAVQAWLASVKAAPLGNVRVSALLSAGTALLLPKAML